MRGAPRSAGAGLALVLVAATVAPAAAQALAAAVLPASRSVQVGAPATAFATILNAGPGTATGCSIAPATVVAADFLFQQTDPLTNALVPGTVNTPVDIPEGGGQSFLIAFTPTAPFEATEVALAFDCDHGDPAPAAPGVNTLLLSASIDPVPDIVALAATAAPEPDEPDGVVRIPSASGQAAFAAAAINVGATGTITVSADTGGASLPLALLLCETVPGTGECVDVLSTPTVEIESAAGATHTLSIFVQASGDVAFDPAGHRIFLRFRQGAATRGATSVAVQTPPRPPDLVGNHSVSGSLTQSACASAANDGTYATTGAMAITAQEDTGPDVASVSGAVSLTLAPGRLLVMPTVSGTVSATGLFEASFAFVGFVDGQFAGTGTGTLQGQVAGEALALTMTAAFAAPTGCHVEGALAVALAPAP